MSDYDRRLIEMLRDEVRPVAYTHEQAKKSVVCQAAADRIEELLEGVTALSDATNRFLAGVIAFRPEMVDEKTNANNERLLINLEVSLSRAKSVIEGVKA